MSNFKEYAENLYLVGLLGKEGEWTESKFFGSSQRFVRKYLESIGFRVMYVILLEGDN
jgi:hypothetical protein